MLKMLLCVKLKTPSDTTELTDSELKWSRFCLLTYSAL